MAKFAVEAIVVTLQLQAYKQGTFGLNSILSKVISTIQKRCTEIQQAELLLVVFLVKRRVTIRGHCTSSKEGTFDIPGLPPVGEGGVLNFCVRSTPCVGRERERRW